jgi:hypothetical protein
MGGQFAPESGGQFDRILHITSGMVVFQLLSKDL